MEAYPEFLTIVETIKAQTYVTTSLSQSDIAETRKLCDDIKKEL